MTVASLSRCLTTDGLDEEPRGDILFAEPLLAQCLERPELVERMQRDALHILSERILLGDTVGTHNARNRLRFGHSLLFDQQLQRSVAAAAGRDFIHAGLGAVGVPYRPYAEALQEAPARNVFGEVFDRNAGLDPAHIGLRENELIEGDVLRPAQGDLGGRVFHEVFSVTGRPEPLSRPSVSVTNPLCPLTLDDWFRLQVRSAQAIKHRGRLL